MTPQRLASHLTLPLAGLVAVESATGVLAPFSYSREVPSWAAQGIGQDAVNVLAIVPALLATWRPMARGSFRGWLIWLGLTIYLAYSYVLYAFFVHFGPLFLPYVATLGLAFYGCWGSVLVARREDLERRFSEAPPATVAWYLLSVSIGFALLWLAEIAGALGTGQPPASAASVGFVVNPIHVLDLGLLLPGMALTGWLLRRRSVYGRLFAVPLLVFSVAMGLALLGMSAAMAWRGLSASAGMAVGSGALATASAWFAYRVLRRVTP